MGGEAESFPFFMGEYLYYVDYSGVSPHHSSFLVMFAAPLGLGALARPPNPSGADE